MDGISEQSSYQNYAEFWNMNAQKIEDIYQNIETELSDLEKLYQPFENKYQNVVELVEVLTSIYSGFNTLQGPEYLLRLHSVLKSYKKRYTRDSIDFSTIDFLMKKITELFDESFNDFPSLEHYESDDLLKTDSSFDCSKYKYKWVTFRSNHSWFIIPFNTLDMYSIKDCEIVSTLSDEEIIVKIHGEERAFRNIFALWEPDPEPIEYFVSIDLLINYSVTQLGKTIYSKTDIISPKVKSFSFGRHHKMSPGRLKIFGKNHIYLYGSLHTRESDQ